MWKNNLYIHSRPLLMLLYFIFFSFSLWSRFFNRGNCAEDIFRMFFLFLFVIQFHLSFNIPIQYNVFKGEFIFAQNSLIQARIFFRKFTLNFIQFIHEFQLLQIKRSVLCILLQKHSLLILIFLIVTDMLYDQIIQRLNIFSVQRDFKVRFMPFFLFVYTFSEILQINHLIKLIVVTFQGANKLQPLLYILTIHIFIFIQDLFDFRNFEDLLFICCKFGLRKVLRHLGPSGFHFCLFRCCLWLKSNSDWNRHLLFHSSKVTYIFILSIKSKKQQLIHHTIFHIQQIHSQCKFNDRNKNGLYYYVDHKFII